ncbi:UNVERIFIED_ORG: transposase-like protein [Pantoea agglomerans]
MNPFRGPSSFGQYAGTAVHGISYRELQEMLAERAVSVNHSTIYRWVQRYAPEMVKRLRWYWSKPSGFCSQHLDSSLS